MHHYHWKVCQNEIYFLDLKSNTLQYLPIKVLKRQLRFEKVKTASIQF
ncbi:unnamed protein product, partial [Rotaria sordida]